MTNQTLMIGTNRLTITQANETEDHIETVSYICPLTTSPVGLRIFDKGCRPHQDRFRYEDPAGGSYTHPSLKGARQMIGRSLIKHGIFTLPEDNSHLDAKNLEKVDLIQKARLDLSSETPRLGDIVYFENEQHRISHSHSFGVQTSKGGSFYIGKGGEGTFSGSLDAPRLKEGFQLSPNTSKARFWMWDAHKGPGAGNGLYIYLNVRAWTFINPNLSQKDAETHPSTLHLCKVFKEYAGFDRTLAAHIQKLLRGFV